MWLMIITIALSQVLPDLKVQAAQDLSPKGILSKNNQNFKNSELAIYVSNELLIDSHKSINFSRFSITWTTQEHDLLCQEFQESVLKQQPAVIITVADTGYQEIFISECSIKRQPVGVIRVSQDLVSHLTRSDLDSFSREYLKNSRVLSTSEAFHLSFIPFAQAEPRTTRRRLESASIQDFDSYANESSTLDAINLYYQGANSTLYSYMVEKLQSYYSGSFQSTEECFLYATAIENLLDPTLLSVQSNSLVELLRVLSLHLYSPSLDYSLFPEINEKFLNIYLLYLNFYANFIDSSSNEFFLIVKSVDNTIVSFVSNITKGTTYTLYQGFDSWSSHYSGLGSLHLQYNKTLITDLADCFCSLCSSPLIVSLISTNYSKILNDADGFSSRLFEAGVYNASNYSITFYEIQNELQVNCLNLSRKFEVYSLESSFGYSCIPENFKCAISSQPSQFFTVNVDLAGLVSLKRNCATGCSLCKTGPAECSSCLDGFYKLDQSCLACHSSCKTCINFNHCLSCKDHAEGPNSLNQCKCAAQYGFDANFNCVACQSSSCSNCSESSNLCVECFEGFFEFNNSCSACLPECSTCESSNSCLTCLAHLNFIESGRCFCQSGFGFNGSLPVCIGCATQNCQKCFLDYLKCEKCSEGFYLNELLACEPCDIRCLTCSGSGSCDTCRSHAKMNEDLICTCDEGLGFNHEGICTNCLDLNCEVCKESSSYCQICIQGYYASSGQCLSCHNSCKSCTSFEKCTSCKENAAGPDSLDQCKCLDHFGFNNQGDCISCHENCSLCGLNSSYCQVCKDRFFEDEGVCKPCHFSCETCLDTSSCTSCKINSESFESFCECQDGYGRDQNQDCSSCEAHCLLCTEDRLTCTSCQIGYFLNTSVCGKCDNTCVSCSTEFECLSCWPNAILTGGSCFCNDGYGKVPTVGSCQSCDEKCNICEKNYLVCQTCKPRHGLNDSICYACSEFCVSCLSNASQCTQCEAHYYLNGPVCSKCAETCENCLEGSSCTSCWEHAHILEDSSCECDSGFGRDHSSGKCKTCSENCLSCEENFQVCKKCEENLGINPETFQCSSCMMHCLNCSTNTNLCLKCEDGFYFNGSSCEKCMKTCKTCGDGISCMTCWDHASLDQQFQCICADGMGTELSTGFCEFCASNCSLCYHNHLTCSSCKDPYGLHPESFLCQNCLEHCLNCSLNSVKCSKCEDGYFLSNDQCQQCSNTCKTCSGIDECLSCWDRATLTSQSCVCEKGFGTDLTTGFCSICEESCEECQVNYLKCTKCKEIQSVGLNHNNQKCEMCSSHCLSCRLNQSECISCDSHFFVKDFECHECLNVCKSCAAINECVECSENSQLVNSMCVCINEYGLNSTGLCESCEDSLCKKCSGNQLICEECKENSAFILESCKCNQFYGKHLKNCELCSDTLCKTCTEDFKTCTACVENTKSGVFPCQCIENASFDSTLKKCLCDEGYLLENSLCMKGTRYLQASNLVSSEFDPDFLSIHIYLNSEIDTSVSPLCPNIIKITSKLGIGAVCSFSNTTTIKISLGLAWTLTSAEALELKADYLIRTSGVFLLAFSDILVFPSYSVFPYRPKAMISGPSQISLGCSNELVQFNGYGSSGINSETFAYDWSVNIEGHQGSTSSIFQVSTSLIAEGSSSLNVSLKVTDIFNNSNSTSILVTLYSNKMLSLSFDSGSSLTVKSGNSFTLQVSIQDYCEMKGSSSFSWSSSPDILPSCKLVSPSRLLVPAQTLVKSQSPYLFTVTASISGVSGSTSVTVNVISSELVLLWNRPTGDISSSLGFTAEAIKSYDPDNAGNPLTCTWKAEPSIVVANVQTDGFSISIPGENFQGLKSFSISVNVSDSTRSTSGSSTYNIVDDLNTVVKMIVPLTRIAVSKQFTISTSITSTSGSSIMWSQLTGPAIIIKPNNFPFISFAANALTAGSSYTFQIAVTESSGKFLRSYANVTTNLPPSCLSSITFSPSSGFSRKTSIFLSINGCRDLDGPDNPVSYTFGYSLNGKDTNLGLASKTNSIKSIFPAGSLTPFVKVCDSLNDCITLKSSDFLSMSSGRRQLKQQDTIEEYEKDCNTYGLINTITVYLESFRVKDELLNKMVQDFEDFCRNEEKNTDLLEVALSVISEFMNDIQSESLAKSYISRYFDILNFLLVGLAEVNDKLSIEVNKFADQVIKLYPDDHHQGQVFELLKNLLNIYQNIGEVIELHSKRLIVYKTINFERFYAKRKLLFGDINLKFPELNFNKSLIIEFKLIIIKLDFPVFQFEIFTNKYFEDYEIIETSKSYLTLNQSAVLRIPNRYDHKVKCKGKALNGSEILCASNTSEHRIKFNFQETGEFKSYQFEGYHERFGLYFSCSILVLWVIFIIFFAHFDSKNLEQVNLIKGENPERKNQSFDSKEPADDSKVIHQSSKLEYHLFLGLFLSKYQILSKTERVSIYLSAVIQMIAWQSFLETASSNDVMLIGFISAILTCPYWHILMILLSRGSSVFKVFGWVLMVLATSLSILCTFFSISSEKWHISLVSGLLIDLLVIQSVSFIAWLKCSPRLIQH